eukprot:1155647-Pelagomonas_calceolata.AAC.1
MVDVYALTALDFVSEKRRKTVPAVKALPTSTKEKRVPRISGICSHLTCLLCLLRCIYTIGATGYAAVACALAAHTAWAVVRQAKRQWFVHLQRSKKGSEGMLLLGRARHMAWQAACQPKLEFGYVNFSTHEVLGPVQQPCTRLPGCAASTHASGLPPVSDRVG